MNCQNFQAMLTDGGERSEEFLIHLRTCESCVDAAIESDPELLFRAIGGPDLVPSGGVEDFVGDVIHQISLRQAERRLAPARTLSAPFRWGVAAALAVVVSGAALWNRTSVTTVPQGAVSMAAARDISRSSAVRPVVDNYDSNSATIVEVPSDNDIQLVMIFDEKLPADL